MKFNEPSVWYAAVATPHKNVSDSDDVISTAFNARNTMKQAPNVPNIAEHSTRDLLTTYRI
jgi:hypothetical protein